MQTIQESTATRRAGIGSMDTIAHTVGAAEVAGVRDALLRIYSVKADALAAAMGAYAIAGPTDLSEIAAHREEFRALEGLLNQLGWERTEGLKAVRVTGSRALLLESYKSALVDAHETVATDVHHLDWPLDALPRIAAAIVHTHTLLERVIELSPTDAPDTEA